MAKKIKWSPEAYEDLKEICDYIKKDSLSYAATVAEKIVNSVKKITQFPEAGRIVPETNKPEIREIFKYSYRIIYVIYDDYILLAGIIHGKRLLENIEDRFQKDN